MKKGNLVDAQDLDGLIGRYSSEVRQLTYLLQQAQENLDQVKELYGKSEKGTKKDASKKSVAKPEKKTAAKAIAKVASKPEAKPEGPKKGRGRPRKEKIQEPSTAKSDSTPKRGRGRPKKSETATIATKTAAVTVSKPAKAPRKTKAPKAPKPPKKTKASKTEKAPKTTAKAEKVQKASKANKPAKVAAEKKPKKSPKLSLKGEESKAKGYRLSEWDLFIINSIRDAKKPMVNSDIMDKAKAKNKKDKVTMSDIDLRGKLNRSIHKLANKRRDLVKTNYPGKGYAYGLAEWGANKAAPGEEHKNGKKA